MNNVLTYGKKMAMFALMFFAFVWIANTFLPDSIRSNFKVK